MKPKQIIILGLIFGILILGILLKSWVRFSGDSAGTALRGYVVLAEFNPVKLEKILLGRGNQSPAVELARENGIWKVKSLWNAKADPMKVENFIQKFRLVQGELRGSGKRLFADFGIEDTDAFSVKLFDAVGASLLDLRLGTKQAGEKAYFIRKVTSESVYLVEINIAELLGIYEALNEATPMSSFWADLSLFNLDSEKVTKIVVSALKGEEKTMIAGLEREADPQDPLKSTWKFLQKDRSSPLDPDKILKFIATMNSVQAQKVVEPGGKTYGLEKPVWELTVAENSREMSLVAGPKDEKGELLYVKGSEDPAIFSLGASFFEDLNVDDAHFEKAASSNPEPPKGLTKNIDADLIKKQGQTA